MRLGRYIAVFSLCLAVFTCVKLASAQTKADYTALQALYEKLPTQSHNRFNAITRYFLSKPFLENPVGEGPDGDYDQRPLWRLDAFDCATFVETLSALYLASGINDFEKTYTDIRYQHGDKRFASRNHFPDADWEANLIQRGLARDVTSEIAGGFTKTYTYTLNRKSWFEHLDANRIFLPASSAAYRAAMLNKLHQLGESYPSAEIVTVQYIPVGPLLTPINQELFSKIPDRAFFGIVRPSQMNPEETGTPMAISHRGFIARNSTGDLVWRHMTLVRGKSIETPMIAELLKRSKQKGFLGIRILQLKE